MGGQCLPPGAKQQDAQQAVAKHVPRLSQECVVGLKADLVDSKQEMHQRKKDMTRVLRRKISRRFDRDDDEPEDQRDPRFQDLVAVAGQASVPGCSQFSQNPQEPGCPFSRMKSSLFNGIVGGFARDHDVMNVALTQAGVADADEARLVQ